MGTIILYFFPSFFQRFFHFPRKISLFAHLCLFTVRLFYKFFIPLYSLSPLCCKGFLCLCACSIERLLKRNVDLIVLNRARSSIAASAINGMPIIIKDRGLYLDFMLRITREAEDFRETVEDYWKTKRAIYG